MGLRESVALGKLLDHPMLPRTAAYWRRLKLRRSYTSAVTDWHEPHWRRGIEIVYRGQPSPDLAALEQHLERELAKR